MSSQFMEISCFMLLFKNKMSKEQSGCRDSFGNRTVFFCFPHVISLLHKLRDWERFIARSTAAAGRVLEKFLSERV